MVKMPTRAMYKTLRKDNTGISPPRQNNQLITDAKEKTNTLNN